MPDFPLPVNENERLDALISYNILDTADDDDFDELTTLASAICGTPIALISLIDAERQWFKSTIGTTLKDGPREYAFCAHAIASFDDIMVVNDATRDERFRNNPLVTGDTQVIFYAGVPLINEDGFALGTLCVIDHQRKELTNDQKSGLKILAKQVVHKLELRRKVYYLEKANQELRDANVFIQKFASMAAHDIKNPVSSILLTSQALKIRLQKLEDEGCGRLVDLNITATKNLLTLLEEMLAYSKSPASLLIKKQHFDLKTILKKVMTLVNIPANFRVHIPEETHELQMSTVAFEQIFINLLSNAIRYNDKENGHIQIRFADDGEFYRFEVEDNGIGIAEQYHEKIFGNNFTLKITDRYNNKGTGIGLSTVKELIKTLQGTIYVKSEPGVGTTFFFQIKK
jgi:signal transduction histidine kinase